MDGKPTDISSNLRKSYGHCIVPAGTLLYRGHVSNFIQSCMFFTLKFRYASHDNGKVVQVWRTKRDIELLFMISFVTHNSWAISPIREIYGLVFPDQKDHKFDDLDIKHFSLKRRNLFIEKLYNAGVKGWFSSYEDKIELEVCFFNPSAQDIQLIEITDRDSDKYFKDSLHGFNLFPSQSFFDKTTKMLKKFNNQDLCSQQMHDRYKHRMKVYVEEAMERYGDREEEEIIRESLNNLRMKLEI